MSPARQETDGETGFGAVSVFDPIDDLQSSIAPMLLDAELRDRTLLQLDPVKRKMAERALQHATQLYETTSWTPEELLERLGCTLSVSPDVSTRKLRSCEHFLGLVVRLVGLVDTTRDRRAVVLECSKLLRATGQDSHGLEDAFEAGSCPAIEYLKLGEISAAGDAVRRRLGGEPQGTNPYASAPTVHLSAPRLEMYIDGRRDLIGDASVFARMDAHIAGCVACQQAVEHRRATQRADYVGEGRHHVGFVHRWTDQAISHFLSKRTRSIADEAHLVEPAAVWSAYHAAHPGDIARMAAIASRCLDTDDFDTLAKCLEPHARLEAELESADLSRRVAAQGFSTNR